VQNVAKRYIIKSFHGERIQCIILGLAAMSVGWMASKPSPITSLMTRTEMALRTLI